MALSGCDPSRQPARRPAQRTTARWIACIAAVGLGVTVTSGCASFNKAFGQREAVVVFKAGTPDQVRRQVRTECSNMPQATPEPLPTDDKASDHLNDVRYRIDKASDQELTQLEQCLRRFSSVVGVNVPDMNS